MRIVIRSFASLALVTLAASACKSTGAKSGSEVKDFGGSGKSCTGTVQSSDPNYSGTYRVSVIGSYAAATIALNGTTYNLTECDGASTCAEAQEPAFQVRQNGGGMLVSVINGGVAQGIANFTSCSNGGGQIAQGAPPTQGAPMWQGMPSQGAPPAQGMPSQGAPIAPGAPMWQGMPSQGAPPTQGAPMWQGMPSQGAPPAGGCLCVRVGSTCQIKKNGQAYKIWPGYDFSDGTCNNDKSCLRADWDVPANVLAFCNQ